MVARVEEAGTRALMNPDVGSASMRHDTSAQTRARDGALKSSASHWQGGDLREAIWRDIKEGTNEYDWYNKGKDVALAVARGLYFLHRNGVVHRCMPSIRLKP